MHDKSVLDAAGTIGWNVDQLEEVLNKLELRPLEQWIINERLKSIRLSIKMLREKANGKEEDVGS